VQWLFEAKKRYGLSILNYMVTSNHVHLLVADDESDAISRSIQLVAGRTAQEFNRRKSRKGAYWEDRYHATAIESGEHLLRCLVYMDMNMVRAGAVSHPSEWQHSGYHEIQLPSKRYRLIDRDRLIALCGAANDEQLRMLHWEWVEQSPSMERHECQPEWVNAIAVGSNAFVSRMAQQMGVNALVRPINQVEDIHMLREPECAYSASLRGEKRCLSPDNTVFYDESYLELIC